MFVVYVTCKDKASEHTVSLAQQVKSSLWPIVFYALTILFLWLDSFDGLNVIDYPWDTVLVAAILLGIYYWGACGCLPQANLSGDKEE